MKTEKIKKLNRHQINALARQIKEEHYDTVVEAARQFNRDLEASEEFQNFIVNNAKCQTLEEFKYLDSFRIEQLQKQIREDYFKDKRMKIPARLEDQKIADLITIAEIEAPDIETLLEKVKKQLW